MKMYSELLEAAQRGHAVAQSTIGLCLQYGEGVAPDIAQAVIWYRKAVEQGNVGAMYNFGQLLLLGAEGVPKDVTAGARLLAAAAQQGQAVALTALAKHARDREVSKACCVGCGAADQLQTCSRCLVASFCGQECVVRMWPVHKPHCRRWRAEAKSAAESSA